MVHNKGSALPSVDDKLNIHLWQNLHQPNRGYHHILSTSKASIVVAFYVSIVQVKKVDGKRCSQTSKEQGKLFTLLRKATALEIHLEYSNRTKIFSALGSFQEVNFQTSYLSLKLSCYHCTNIVSSKPLCHLTKPLDNGINFPACPSFLLRKVND